MSQPSELTRLTTMAEYCKEHNLRLVTNMSYGSAYGPHDGSDLFAQALEGLINKYDIIACVSAGNYADQPLVEKHTFTGEETDELKGLYNLEKSYNLIKNYSEVTRINSKSYQYKEVKKCHTTNTFTLFNSMSLH